MSESTYHQIHFAWAEPTLLGRVGPGPAASSLSESDQPALRSWRDRLTPALTVDYRSALPGTDPADLPETLWSRTYADGQAALVYRWPGDVREAHAWAVVGPAHGLTLPRILSLHENPNTRPAGRRPPAPGWAAMPTLEAPAPWELTAAPGAVRTRDRRAAETTVQGESVLVGAVASALHSPDRPIRIALEPEHADLWQATQIRLLWGVHRILHDVLTPPRAIPAAGWQWSFSTYDPDLSTEGQHLAFGPPGPETDGPFLQPPAPDHRRVAERLVEVLRDEGGDALADHLRDRGVAEAPTFGDRRALLLEWLDPRAAPAASGAATAGGIGGGVPASGGDEAGGDGAAGDGAETGGAGAHAGDGPGTSGAAAAADPDVGEDASDARRTPEATAAGAGPAERLSGDPAGDRRPSGPRGQDRPWPGGGDGPGDEAGDEDDLPDAQPLPSDIEAAEASEAAPSGSAQEHGAAATADGTRPHRYPLSRSVAGAHPSLRLSRRAQDDDGAPLPEVEDLDAPSAAREAPVHHTPEGEAPRRPPGPSRPLFGERRAGPAAPAEQPLFGAPEPHDPPSRAVGEPPPLRLPHTPEPDDHPETPEEHTPRPENPDPAVHEPGPRGPRRLGDEQVPVSAGARRHAEEAFGGPARLPEEEPPDELADADRDPAPRERSPEQAPPLMVAHDEAPAPDYAAETEPEVDTAFDDSGANWPTRYADLPLARLERWHAKRGPEGAHTDVVDARAAVRAERSELQRVRDERDHYHAEVQDLRREVARLDRPFLDGDTGHEGGAATRRWPARLLAAVLMLAFLATGLEAGARFGVGTLDVLSALPFVP